MSASSSTSSQPRVTDARAVRNPYLAVVLAWLVPGAGHLYLGRWPRALTFLALILVSVILGCYLEGRLFEVLPDQPLSRLGTLASMGMGIPYFVLRYGLEYEGNLVAASYEYGGAFILTAGLMNLLVILDAWDISVGRKG